MVPFSIMLYKVVLTFDSVDVDDEIQMCGFPQWLCLFFNIFSEMAFDARQF